MGFWSGICSSIDSIETATTRTTEEKGITDTELIDIKYEALKQQIKADHEKLLKKKKAFHEAPFKQEGK